MCFYIVRVDGTIVDFSYKKCITKAAQHAPVA